MEQESEMYNFIKVWLSVFAALSYCYVIGKIAPKGAPRLVPVLPVVGLFLVLPLGLNSIHLGGSTAFFIAWLANFKLLLFAFGQGPLASDPSISLPRFIALACLPIKTRPTHQTDPSQKTTSENQENTNPIQNGRDKRNPPPQKEPQKGHKSPINYGIKILLLATMLRIYDYSDRLPQKVIWFLYICHIYFCLEIILAIVATVARAALGLELEPQFDEPYLSTSLQDFWGRRWNIMVTRILRPTVYEPVREWASRAVGRKYAALPAVLGTFVVSAIMHELIFYYLGRVRPTWEITCFFLFHGVCLMVEIAVKKELKLAVRLPRPAAAVLTVGFVMATAFWWFLPPLLRCRADERAFGEYAAVGVLVRDVGRGLGSLTGALNASSPAKP